MASSTAIWRRIPPYIFIISAALIAMLAAAMIYLNKPAAKPAREGPSAEATAYLSSLELSDVKMQAAENFMQQKVVEIDGKITNKGPRPIERIDVYCIFSDVDGKQIYRERASVVRVGPNVSPLEPNQTRTFRLPFDTLPESWNQGMSRLMIAQIVFAH